MNKTTAQLIKDMKQTLAKMDNHLDSKKDLQRYNNENGSDNRIRRYN